MSYFIANKFKDITSSMGNIEFSEKSKYSPINLGIGDIDITTDNLIIKKAMNDAINGYTHYTDPLGLDSLRESICKYHRNNFKNYLFSKDNVLITTGACHGLYLLIKTITNPNDEIILIAPFFPVYIDSISLSNGITKIVETKFSNDFQIIKEDLEKVITKKTKAIIINSPSNPTGVCYNLKSLEILREIALKYNLLIISDEVYDFFSYEKEFLSIYTLPNMKDRTVVIRSFSKNFAMTGWRIAYNIGPKKIIDCMSSINENIIYSAPSISQRCAIYALKDFKRLKNLLVPIFKKRIEYSYKRIQNIYYLNCFKPQGGIYLFVNIQKTKMTSDEFSKFLIDNYGILVISGKKFGAEGFIRIACTVPISILKEAFDRLERIEFK